MKPTTEEFNRLKIYASQNGTLSDYVWLRKDSQGTYIEYAFIDGAPHDNRCLSWYDSFQPNAIKRNCIAFGDSEEEIANEVLIRKSRIEKRVNGLYRLWAFTCGHEMNNESAIKRVEESWKKYHPDEPFVPEDHVCRVGCPAPICVKNKHCAHWTYEEPVKCACWVLDEIKHIPETAPVAIDEITKKREKLEKKIEEILKNVHDKIYYGDIERGWEVYGEFEKQLKLLTENDD